jgi:hypothetical protein
MFTWLLWKCSNLSNEFLLFLLHRQSRNLDFEALPNLAMLRSKNPNWEDFGVCLVLLEIELKGLHSKRINAASFAVEVTH